MIFVCIAASIAFNAVDFVVVADESFVVDCVIEFDSLLFVDDEVSSASNKQ